MNTKKLIQIAGVLLTLLAGNVYAQDPSVGITDAEGAQGQIVAVDMEWAPGAGDYPGIQFDVTYDVSKVTWAGCGLNEPYASYALATCGELSPGRLQIVLLVQLLGTDIPVPGGVLGSLDFTIANDAPFSPPGIPVVVENVVLFGDPNVVTNDGEITVLGPVFDGTATGLNTMTVIQNQPNPSGTLEILNDGGAGTTLTGSCSSDNPVFTVESGSPFSILDTDPATTVVVSCDSSSAIQLHTGTLTCNSNDAASPDTFALSCNVSDGPQPVFNSDPAPGPIFMEAEYEGFPIADVNIAIDNNSGQVAGELVSVLTGTCSLQNADPQITLVSDGAFSLEVGDTADVETIRCDSSQSSFGGVFEADLVCDHNAQGTPAIYNIDCEVGPKEPAELDSDPVAGAITDMTPGDVKTGDDIPDQQLTFENIVGPLGADLDIDCDFVGDPGEISVTDLQTNTLDPGDTTSVTFSCDNSVAEESSATYTCNWNSVEEQRPGEDGVPTGGTVSYEYNCDVREAEADVISTPPDGAVLTEQVPGGGSATFNIVFEVDVDEDVDGELVNCTTDDDVNFIVQSPDFPAVIPSDGSVTVSVLGNDPGGVDELQTTLRCETIDSDSPEGEDWTYTLVMEIGSYATFRVTKFFEDDNPADVRVELSCNHGLPLVQGFNISQDQDVNFVLGDFADGEPTCTITEVSVDGYETIYYAQGESDPTSDADGCYFDNVGRGDVNICNITNDVLPVKVEVTKEWLMAGQVGNNFDMIGTIQISSPTEIVSGQPCNYREDSLYNGNYCAYLDFEGPETDTQFVMVYPAWDGVTVYIDEDVTETYIETDNDCGGSVEIFPGDGDSCTVTNSVFFEGIPTLNQYGLALMALLMLGVGMVGFRRFV